MVLLLTAVIALFAATQVQIDRCRKLGTKKSRCRPTEANPPAFSDNGGRGVASFLGLRSTTERLVVAVVLPASLGFPEDKAANLSKLLQHLHAAKQN